MKKYCFIAAQLLTTLVLYVYSAFAYAVPLPAAPATLAQRDICMAEAIAHAREEMIQREGMTILDLNNYLVKASFVRLENDENAWVVMLDEKGYGTDTLVTISADGQRVLDYQSTNTEITALLVQLWKAKKGEMKTWSVEDKALFNWMFGNQDQILLPDDNCISREKAGEIAIAQIGQSLSLSDCSFSFGRLSSADAQSEQFVWMVTIIVNGQEAYLVHVDAVDGAVIEQYELHGNG